jgi:hypothetical protein
MKNQKEEWRKIGNFNYEVSNTGLIRHLSTKKLHKTHPDKRGYLMMCFNIHKGLRVSAAVHRIVCSYFSKYNHSCHHLTVNHIDGDVQNNNIKNLEWLTKGDNCRAYWHIRVNRSMNHKDTLIKLKKQAGY